MPNFSAVLLHVQSVVQYTHPFVPINTPNVYLSHNRVAYDSQLRPPNKTTTRMKSKCENIIHTPALNVAYDPSHVSLPPYVDVALCHDDIS
jgi:hypothetical protein